ncbi:MAG: caspase family protein [Armatimonadota bacterium]
MIQSMHRLLSVALVLGAVLLCATSAQAVDVAPAPGTTPAPPLATPPAAPGRPAMVLQTGHAEPITSLVYSPDGTRLASTGFFDRRLLVWNLQTGLIEHQLMVNACNMEFSADNAWLLYNEIEGSANYHPRLYSLKSGQLVGSIDAFPIGTYAVHIHHDGRHVWTAIPGGPSNGLKFNLPKIKPLAEYPALNTQVVAPIRTSRLSLLALPGLEQAHAPLELPGLLLAISPDDTCAVTAVHQKQPQQPEHFWRNNEFVLVLWDLKANRELRRFPAMPGAPCAVAFSSDGVLLAVLSTFFDDKVDLQHTIHVLSTQTGKEERMFPLKVVSATGPLRFLAENRQLLAFGDFLYKRWNLENGDLIEEIRLPGGGFLKQAAVNPAGRLFAYAGNMILDDPSRGIKVQNTTVNIIHQYSTEKGSEAGMISPGLQLQMPEQLLCNPAGTLAALVPRDGDLLLWDLPHGRISTTVPLLFERRSPRFRLPQSPFYSNHYASFLPDGRRLLVAATPWHAALEPLQLIAYDLQAGSEARAIHPLPGVHPNNYLAVLSPDGARLATIPARLFKNAAGEVPTDAITLWDTTNWTRCGTLPLPGLPKEVQGLAYTPDGTRLLVSCATWADTPPGAPDPPHTPYLIALDLTKNPPTIAYQVDSGGTYLAYTTVSPDGHWIIYGTGKENLALREAKTGREVWRFNQKQNWEQFAKPYAYERLSGDTAIQTTTQLGPVTCIGFSPESNNVLFRYIQGQQITKYQYLQGKPSLTYRLNEESGILALDMGNGTTRAIHKLPEIHNAMAVQVYGKGKDARLAAVTRSGQLILWKLADVLAKDNAPPLIILQGDATGRWLATTPNGYYDCSLEAENAVAWRLPNGQVFPFDAFAAVYRRPDIVQKALAGEDIANLPPLDVTQPPPTVAFTAPAYGKELNTEERLLASIEAKGSTPIARVEVTVNGQPLPPALADKLVLANPTEKTLKLTNLPVPAPPGEQRLRLRAVAYDTRGFKSLPAEVTVFRPGAQAQPGTLHVLAVGINDYPRLPPGAQLAFSVADATALAQVGKAQSGGAPYAQASVTLLTDADASLSRLKIALRQLKDTPTENDTVLLFMAGHGLQDAQGNYYFPTHDADLKNLPATALSWQDFHAALREVRAKRVLVLADTCQSGGMLGANTATNTELALKLNKLAHRLVFVACRGDESSIEKKSWGHGAFTKALLEAFAGQGDANKDNQISFQELKSFVEARVAELTNYRQHPQLPYLDQFEPDAVLGCVVKQ